MATINFPSAPANQQEHTENGVTYQYWSNISAWLVVTNPISLSNTRTFGKETIGVPAGALIPRETNGAEYTTYELPNNDIVLYTLDFDATTSEGAGIWIPMPKSWDEGNITIQPICTANANTGNVVFEFSAISYSHQDNLDNVFSTNTTSLIAITDPYKCLIGPESSALTVTGTPAEGDLVYVQVTRKVSDALDTLTVDAKLQALRIYFTTNAGNDQ